MPCEAYIQCRVSAPIRRPINGTITGSVSIHYTAIIPSLQHNKGLDLVQDPPNLEREWIGLGPKSTCGTKTQLRLRNLGSEKIPENPKKKPGSKA